MARSTSSTDKLQNDTILASLWSSMVWSVSGWVDAGSTAGLFAADAGSNTSRGWHISKDSGSGKIIYTHAGIADYTTAISNPTGLFHVCIVAVSSTEVRVYINGTVDVQTVSGLSEPLDAGMVIGGTNRYGGLRLAANYAEWAVWDVALTAAEVASLSKGFAPSLIRPGSLVNYWPIIGRYSPEIDVMGGGGLTLTGTSAAAHPRVIYPRRRGLGITSGAASPSPIDGSAAGGATASGSLTGVGAAAGSASGAGATSGALIGTGALAASASGAATTAGEVTGTGALVGTSAGEAATVAALVGTGALAGAAAGVATVSGAFPGTAAPAPVLVARLSDYRAQRLFDPMADRVSDYRAQRIHP